LHFAVPRCVGQVGRPPKLILCRSSDDVDCAVHIVSFLIRTLINATASGYRSNANLHGCRVVIRIEDMPTNTNNSVKSLAPNWKNIWCMIMICSAKRQDVGIVYDLNRKFLSLAPSHFVSRFRCITLSVERELTVLGNDITNRRRPSSRFHAVNYNPSDHKLA